MHPSLSILANKAGVQLTHRWTENSFIFDGESIALWIRPEEYLDDSAILHEICHYMAAHPEQRDLPEYGLSNLALPYKQEYCPQVVDEDECFLQESITQMLCIYYGQKYNISPVISAEPDYVSTWEEYLSLKLKEMKDFFINFWEVFGRVVEIISTQP